MPVGAMVGRRLQDHPFYFTTWAAHPERLGLPLPPVGAILWAKSSKAVVRNDPQAMGRVLFNHVVNDWRDVVRRKIDVAAAIFSGEESNNLPSQRWAASVIPNATLYVYSAADQGDHFLMFKNPVKFTADLRSFLER